MLGELMPCISFQLMLAPLQTCIYRALVSGAMRRTDQLGS